MIIFIQVFFPYLIVSVCINEKIPIPMAAVVASPMNITRGRAIYTDKKVVNKCGANRGPTYEHFHTINSSGKKVAVQFKIATGRQCVNNFNICSDRRGDLLGTPAWTVVHMHTTIL